MRSRHTRFGWETLTILRVGEENAAPTSALPLGSSRIFSRTKLSRVDPTGPAHVVRLLNTVLAVVAIHPADRLKVENAKQSEVKEEKTEGEAGVEGDVKVEVADHEDEEDEVPYKEEIGWREVLGFIVM
jgi:polyribonucleotide 5'-hydroxyl-kinase